MSNLSETKCTFRNDAEAMFGGHKIFAAEEMFDIFDLDKDDELGKAHIRRFTYDNLVFHAN